MKKCLLLFPFFILSYFSYSQPFGSAAPGYRIIRLDYNNGSGELGTTWFRYSSDGNLDRSLWALDNGTRSSENSFETDVNGKVISAFRKFSDSITSTEIFEYDKEGNKTSEQFFRSDGRRGGATYFYQDGILKRALFKKYKGWFSGEASYFHQDNGRLDSASVSEDGKPVCVIFYQYDSVGNLIREYWDFEKKWYQDFRYVYEQYKLPRSYYASPYPGLSSRKRIAKEFYNFNDKLTGPSFYFYNTAGELEKKIFERSDGMQTKTLYSYDDAHRLVSSWREVSNGNSMKFTYRYDAANRLVLRICTSADTLYSFESYQYKASGELIAAYLWNMDGWLSGTILFTNNYMGLPISGVYSGMKGENGEKGEKAILHLDYNRNLELVKIRWDFTGGIFQEYGFQYE